MKLKPSWRENFKAESSVEVIRRSHSTQSKVVLHDRHDVLAALAVDQLIVVDNKPSPTTQIHQQLNTICRRSTE